MPTIFSGPVTGSPATTVAPARAGSRPDTSFISVDLPHPLGPTTAAELAPAHLQVHAVQDERGGRVAAVGQADVSQLDKRVVLCAFAPARLHGGATVASRSEASGRYSLVNTSCGAGGAMENS